MAESKKAELVFIPSPGAGHLHAAVEMAKLLTERDERLLVTVLIMKHPTETKSASYTDSQGANTSIRFIELPGNGPSVITNFRDFVTGYIEGHKGHVRDAVAKLVDESSLKIRLAGFIVDMFCVTMIDIANEFNVPSYVFFTSGAAVLGLMFHLQNLIDDQGKDMMEYKDSNVELSVPTFVNPVPTKVWPSTVFDSEGGSSMFFDLMRRFRETQGIMVNTFSELEPFALKALSDDGKIPPVYFVGPILHISTENKHNEEHEEIMAWLDMQPHSSVVFLCFGSLGSFEVDQVQEIATALEQSGYRFLWSLRKPPPKDRIQPPSNYENLDEALPEGFLLRTASMGKVIGWAPQMAVLSHPAVGGFVSHCGWNSTLEAVYSGVTVAAWPLYAEQQLNAFQLVKELGIAAEIKMDYQKGSQEKVAAEVVQSAIQRVMGADGDIRVKTRELKEKSRTALMEGGSSYVFLGRLIDDVMNNIP